MGDLELSFWTRGGPVLILSVNRSLRRILWPHAAGPCLSGGGSAAFLRWDRQTEAWTKVVLLPPSQPRNSPVCSGVLGLRPQKARWGRLQAPRRLGTQSRLHAPLLVREGGSLSCGLCAKGAPTCLRRGSRAYRSSGWCRLLGEGLGSSWVHSQLRVSSEMRTFPHMAHGNEHKVV